MTASPENLPNNSRVSAVGLSRVLTKPSATLILKTFGLVVVRMYRSSLRVSSQKRCNVDMFDSALKSSVTAEIKPVNAKYHSSLTSVSRSPVLFRLKFHGFFKKIRIGSFIWISGEPGRNGKLLDPWNDSRSFCPATLRVFWFVVIEAMKFSRFF